MGQSGRRASRVLAFPWKDTIMGKRINVLVVALVLAIALLSKII